MRVTVTAAGRAAPAFTPFGYRKTRRDGSRRTHTRAMTTTIPDRPVIADLLGPPPAMTFESLAARLRDGPLRTMLTLQIKAGTLAAVAENDRQRLEKLVELLQLTQMAAKEFQYFKVELQNLIDDLTAGQQQGPPKR